MRRHGPTRAREFWPSAILIACNSCSCSAACGGARARNRDALPMTATMFDHDRRGSPIGDPLPGRIGLANRAPAWPLTVDYEHRFAEHEQERDSRASRSASPWAASRGFSARIAVPLTATNGHSAKRPYDPDLATITRRTALI